MSRPFPTDDPFLRGNFAPWLMEGDAHDLPVSGEVPAELSGALYRIGSNPQFAPRGGYHWFFGDGMVHAFFVRDGKVSYRNRWVRTERFLAERGAGEALVGMPGDPPDPRAEGVSFNPANTNVLRHAGRLLALCEGGEPYVLSGDSLETEGPLTYGGRLEGAMTAHVKIDPETGQMLGYGYSSFPPFLRYHEVSAEGDLTRSFEVPVDVPTMMHDFLVTRNHVVFMRCPATMRPEHLASGNPIRWEPELGTRLGVMPRGGGPDDVTWLETDPCYVFHPMNAYEDGRRIVADVCRYPRLPLFDEGDGPAAPANLTRWILDLDAGTVKEERLDDRPSEFPRLDERHTGLPYRFGFTVSGNPGREVPGPTSLVRYDHETGSRHVHDFGEDVPSEPVFVPRGPRSPEGEGFLLSVVYRSAENRSDLVVFDAETLEAEPLAVVALPHRVPFGFHGNWADDRS